MSLSAPPSTTENGPQVPQFSAVLELLKPITWFPPMWALMCGAISSGQPLAHQWVLILAGVFLTGPLVCASSQAINDWFDRHVDAINEPNRPIPSGRMPGTWGLYVALIWMALSIILAASLGTWVLLATAVGLFFAWIYSAPPLRLKQNGWWGNSAVALCYEGLPWVTGAALLTGGTMPGSEILLAAALYSLGAHGIMTLNDFKAIEGDQRMGIASIPVQLGVTHAARLAWGLMAIAQIVVVACLWLWGKPLHAVAVFGLVAGQAWMARRFLADPIGKATWFSGMAVSLYVSGMMICAFALAGRSAA